MSNQSNDMANRESKDDAALVADTLAGDRGAFDVLVERHQRQVVSVAYRTLGNLHDALEIAQDTFFKAYQALDSLEKPAAFRGWLLRITANLALNYRRSRSRAQTQALDECILPDSEPAAGAMPGQVTHDERPEDRANVAELEEQIQKALMDLPEKTRMALVLFSIEKMPQKEVADVLDISVEAVKWHVFTARKKMKERLAAYL